MIAPFKVTEISEGERYPDAILWACSVNSDGVDEQSVCAGLNIPLPFKIRRLSDYTKNHVTGYAVLRLFMRRTDIVYRDDHIHGLDFAKFLDVMR